MKNCVFNLVQGIVASIECVNNVYQIKINGSTVTYIYVPRVYLSAEDTFIIREELEIAKGDAVVLMLNSTNKEISFITKEDTQKTSLQKAIIGEVNEFFA